MQCSQFNCDSKAIARTLCKSHYRKVRQDGQLDLYPRSHKPRQGYCNVEDCKEPDHSAGYCNTHYRQHKKGLTPGFIAAAGKTTVTSDGYRMVPVPGRYKMLEHRYVMEQHLARPLLPEENVHHKNGDRLDNRLSNLELWNTSQPRGQRIQDKLEWAYEIIERYGV